MSQSKDLRVRWQHCVKSLGFHDESLQAGHQLAVISDCLYTTSMNKILMNVTLLCMYVATSVADCAHTERDAEQQDHEYDGQQHEGPRE